ncbi:MAG TPA: carbohydrate-binding family 9-like protein [Anaeromyxobacteraceae bacterium]|nr:carbohydrate-binding family 9-like protein [Anaeromyxobacteraceae bacterium]
MPRRPPPDAAVSGGERRACAPHRFRGLPARVRAAALAAAVAAGCRDPEAGPGKLSGARSLPVYRVAIATGPIEVDGRLDEPAWREALQMPLVDSLTGQRPREPTVARVLRDERHLYVAFDCRDDAVFVRPGRRHDDPLWEDEVVEVFLDPSGAGRDYVEVEVSPAGVTFDARFRSWRSDLLQARAWESGAAAAAWIDRGPAGDRGWTAELRIPLDAARGAAPPPRPGSRWRANLYRLETRGRGGPAGQAFSPPYRGDFHALDRFGWLVFD